ncbi:Uma2 family endonuclease [Euhalothece natronophila Z-M001]|uniref:Uma2 family endonuclease n=1 Tax=Euhalothece natronophila Z-M001 TaxID=522448 RepID=A0A5B8NQY6_9CHRO|nr:Uma2 family endonuclease [Euhalothece natronophila]QDZ40625.1 Uma2 family endonuclease [Euhalothece natronophila Z-M001]
MSLITPTQLQHFQGFIDLAKSKESNSESIFIINNVIWQDYEKLLEITSDESGILLKYSQGHLQVMSPSSRHEIYKENIGILLECYFLAKKIRFYSLGSTTFHSQSLSCGIEPDKSYCINSRKDIPDLAIEVIITHGGINSLEIYKALEVTEVWFWEEEKLTVYVLQNQEYIQANQSSLFPDLPLELFATYIPSDEPFDAVLEFSNQI